MFSFKRNRVQILVVSKFVFYITLKTSLLQYRHHSVRLGEVMLGEVMLG